MLLRSARETKVKLGPWRSKERVVRDGVLVYAVGSLIPREEAVRQGLVKEEGAAGEQGGEGAGEQGSGGARGRGKT